MATGRSAAKVGTPLLLSAIIAGIYVLVTKGVLMIDLGIGRRKRALGPWRITIDAPRQTVFDLIAAPYLGRPPRAMRGKPRVIERSTDSVLAEHFTPVEPITAVTVEMACFERPERVRFRLVRGPVAHVMEEFLLGETAALGTELVYSGEMGADLWGLGT